MQGVGVFVRAGCWGVCPRGVLGCSPMQGVWVFAHAVSLPVAVQAVHSMVQCCFTSTETVGLLGTGAQDVRLDFHTAPKL